MRSKRKLTLKYKVLRISLLVLIPVIATVAALFYHTRQQLRQKAIEKMEYNLNVVTDSMDAMISDIYNTSSYLAAEPGMQKILFRDYSEQTELKKRIAVVDLNNKIFRRFESLKAHHEITAVYTYKDILFNFEDPNCDGKDVINQLMEIGIDDRENLSRFCWYPLQDNFLRTTRSGEMRKDKVIIGSRRIFSMERSDYIAIHIFALTEESLYEKYHALAMEAGGDVYILNGHGELLSSSDLKAVETGKMEEALWNQVSQNTQGFQWSKQGEEFMVRIGESKINDWKTVFVASEKNVTREIDRLYVNISIILLICLLLCACMVIYLYRSFMVPISVLNSAMEEVYHGNLNAFVEVSSENEAGRMMTYYNAMLQSINTNLDEKIAVERKKKGLELEVLMNQINPHFLYNTLETIVWKSGEAGRYDIGRIAASLGRLYRLSINNGHLMIRFQQEVEHLMSYVNIQKSRYEDLFQMELDFDIDAIREYYTLKMILQPVVENSFLYGMNKISHVMTIRLNIKVLDDVIRIRILDNGCGMNKERLAVIRRQIREGYQGPGDAAHDRRKSLGIGLYNISERLILYFEERNPVKIYSREGVGTMTVISIPKLTREISLEKEE